MKDLQIQRLRCLRIITSSAVMITEGWRYIWAISSKRKRGILKRFLKS